MTLTRSILVGLALVLGGAPVLFSAVAEAADAPIPAAGLLEIVPPAAVQAGAGPIDVAVLAWTPDGKGLAGLKLKPEASAGTATNWREIQAGTYAFTWTPPSSALSTVTWSVKLKATATLTSTVTVPVAPADAPLVATSNPPEITLGANAESTLSLVSSGAPAIRATSGEVKTLTAMGAGKYTAKYVAPTLPFPHLAIVTATDGSNPAAAGGHVVILLNGSVNFPVTGPPSATVVLKVSGREFGPVQLAADGSGAVPINVPPGVTEGIQITVANGQTTEAPLDLRVPETRRVAMYPLPLDVPGGTVVPVRAVVVTPDGKANAGAKVVFSATRGSVSAPRHQGNGVFVADWTAPADGGAAKVTVSVDGSKIQNDEIDVSILPARPAKVTLIADPLEIGPDTTSVKITARVVGTDGKPLPGKVVEFGGSGMLKGPVTDGKNGDYTATLGVPSGTPLRVGVIPHAPVSRNAVRQVVVLPESRVASDSNSKARIFVMATDGYGYPVANRKVTLSLLTGDGKLSETSVTTDADGIARVDYAAGNTAGLVRIQASSDAAVGFGSLAQIPANAFRLETPTNGGVPSDIARAWAAAAPTVVVPAKGAPVPAPVAPTAAPGLAAAGTKPAIIDLTVPTSSASGATLVVTASPLDGTGKAIPGAQLDFLTSLGTFGPVTEKDGAYSATLTLPAGSTGTAKVSIMHDSGASALGKIEVGGSAAVVPVAAPAPATGSPWGAPAPAPAPAPAAAPEPVAVAPAPAPAPVVAPKPPKEPKAPQAAGDNPWLRARASGVGGTYSYEQRPSEAPGELLNVPLLVGGPDGGRPASPLGFEIDARAWVPSVQYLGFHAQIRETYYQVDSSAFSDPAQDWLADIRLDVNGRYPFEVGSDQFWIGAKAGFRYNDFMIFKGCLEDGCTVSYEPLGVPGLGIGPELGVEIGDGYFITAYDLGLASGTRPYSNGIDANVGYAFIDHLFADLGFGWTSRQVLLTSGETGDDRGELNDQQLTIELGIGWEM